MNIPGFIGILEQFELMVMEGGSSLLILPGSIVIVRISETSARKVNAPKISDVGLL